MSKATMLHELAHAWTDINLDEAETKAFAAWRGLAAWNDPDDPWEHRATEHAAEIIAWALLDEPDHARFVVTSHDEAPRPVFRLLTIEDSAVEALHDGFVRLTGMEPRFRSPVEWDSEALEAVWQAKMASATSPERRTPSTAVASETPSEIEVHDCADRVLLQKAGIAVAGC